MVTPPSLQGRAGERRETVSVGQPGSSAQGRRARRRGAGGGGGGGGEEGNGHEGAGAGCAQLVELLVVADGQLDVARDDAGLLVVAGGVAGELEDLGAEVLEHGGQVDRRAGSDARRRALQVAVDAANRELEPGLGGPGLGPGLRSLLSASALALA
eukprot:COSAG06_NODE_9248_length_1947_cov_3.209416_1_plen_156_part_00